MGQRVTYRRRLSYNTESNRVRKIKTPGITHTIKAPDWLSSTSRREAMAQEHLMTPATAANELMASPS